mmetsp:Transcript_11259/g.38383  ORF Transcript_11259/g.38383 Transcript_11259/m.38383 type:complete len:243 (-) Transcript_11259:91-819(-)
MPLPRGGQQRHGPRGQAGWGGGAHAVQHPGRGPRGPRRAGHGLRLRGPVPDRLQWRPGGEAPRRVNCHPHAHAGGTQRGLRRARQAARGPGIRPRGRLVGGRHMGARRGGGAQHPQRRQGARAVPHCRQRPRRCLRGRPRATHPPAQRAQPKSGARAPRAARRHRGDLRQHLPPRASRPRSRAAEPRARSRAVASAPGHPPVRHCALARGRAHQRASQAAGRRRGARCRAGRRGGAADARAR